MEPVFQDAMRTHTTVRGGSAPPDVPDRPVADPTVPGPRVIPRIQVVEPDVNNITPDEARFLVMGIDRRLRQLTYAGFRFCQTRGQIIETLEIGQLNDEDLRRLVLAAMTRGWRLDTLVLLIIKAYQQ